MKSFVPRVLIWDVLHGPYEPSKSLYQDLVRAYHKFGTPTIIVRDRVKEKEREREREREGGKREGEIQRKFLSIFFYLNYFFKVSFTLLMEKVMLPN